MKKYIFLFIFLIGVVLAYFYFSLKIEPSEPAIQTEVPESGLAKELDSIFTIDQRIRLQADSATRLYGREDKRTDSLWKRSHETDSSNIRRVCAILDSIGTWPEHEVTGRNGHNGLFFVIQHADLKVQEKYLPMIRKAASDELLPKFYLALLEDRVLIRNHKKQLYGSQLDYDKKKKCYYVIPIKDPDSVDLRRFRMGMEAISLYVSRWDIVWDVEKYKKELPYIERLEKARKE